MSHNNKEVAHWWARVQIKESLQRAMVRLQQLATGRPHGRDEAEVRAWYP